MSLALIVYLAGIAEPLKNFLGLSGVILLVIGVIWGNLEPWKKQGEVWLPGGLIHERYLFKDNRVDLDNLLNTNNED